MASSATSRHKDVILSSAGITAMLVLAEPVVYLYGFTKSEQLERPPAIVRGSLILRVTKPTKIKGISLKFRGISRTEWPEGIPSEKSETQETKEVFAHEWRLFSSHFSNAETSSGAHQVTVLDQESASPEDADSAANNQSLLSAALHPSSTLSASHSLVNQHDAVNKGYRVFNAAEYVYNFELLLPQRLPETLKCNFGHVKWGFDLGIERHGTFKSKLTGHKDFTVLRSLGPSNLESSEPIVISRDWEDLLHYEIIIAGKAFAIGQTFNIAFSLVPMAKVKCHRLRLYITEHVEYYCRNRRIHRVEPSHKFMLLEHPPKGDSHTNILEPAVNGMSGLCELEFDVKIPESFPNRRDYLRPNANTEYIKVHHWIKAIMRLSRLDTKVDGKPKCYEVSIDSPITLVDSRTTGANELPAYSGSPGNTVGDMVAELRPYQEFVQKSSPLTSSQRAILFARQPSIAPPPFDADVRPPEIQPPPTYDQLRENPESYQFRYSEHLRLIGQAPSTGGPAGVTEHGLIEDSNSSASSRESSTGANGAGPSTVTPVSRSSDEGARSVALGDADSPFVAGPVPVFSEIIWTEEEQGSPGYEDSPDPHTTQVTQREGMFFANTPSPVGSYEAQNFMDAFNPASSAMSSRAAAASEPPTRPVASRLNDDSLSSQLPAERWPPGVAGPSETRGTASRPQPGPVSPMSTPNVPPLPFGAVDRYAATNLPPSAVPNAPTTPDPIEMYPSQATATSPGTSPSLALQTGDRDQMGRLYSRSSGSSSTSGSGSISRSGGLPMPGHRGDEPESPLSPRATMPAVKRNTPASAPSSMVPARVPSQIQIQRMRGIPVAPTSRRTSLQSSKSTKTPSQSAGSPVGGVWPETNANQLFGERWMDPVASGVSPGGPRYFRQSSIVSIDLVRQGEAALVDSRRASRRVSEVSEISEVTEWHPLSRNNSEASVSIAEYESFHDRDRRSGGQGRAPLLGDNESVDMALGMGPFDDYDYDYDLEDDNRSISSAVYNVLTP